jgi:hypothetical protein
MLLATGELLPEKQSNIFHPCLAPPRQNQTQ